MRYERSSSITGLAWLLMWVLALLVPDIRSALATDEGIAGAPPTELSPQTSEATSGTARSREQALYTRSLQLLKRQPRPGAALGTRRPGRDRGRRIPRRTTPTGSTGAEVDGKDTGGALDTLSGSSSMVYSRTLLPVLL